MFYVRYELNLFLLGKLASVFEGSKQNYFTGFSQVGIYKKA